MAVIVTTNQSLDTGNQSDNNTDCQGENSTLLHIRLYFLKEY